MRALPRHDGRVRALVLRLHDAKAKEGFDDFPEALDAEDDDLPF